MTTVPSNEDAMSRKPWHGLAQLHSYFGREPSGATFNMSRRCTQQILSILSAFSVHEKYSPLLCKCTQSVPAIEMQT